ncbi:hypothetical protein GCM10025795_30390 [Verticiella sediminum]
MALALHALVASASLLRRILALNVLSSAVFLLLVAIARRAPDGPPDPLPHAMVLTGIVVAVSASAFALVLLKRLHDAGPAPAEQKEDAVD